MYLCVYIYMSHFSCWRHKCTFHCKICLSSLYNFSCDLFLAGKMSIWLNSQAFQHLEHLTWNLHLDIPSHQAHNSWYVYGSRTSHTGGAHTTMLCVFSLVLYMGWSLGQSFGVLAHKGTLLFRSSIFYCTAILEHEFHCHPCKRKKRDRQTEGLKCKGNGGLN